ncbi:hypothetical protein XNC1_0696 [Xenorhabdus nematophila ATCC 19061]|uniref:Uncharacterized protein n=1 Tax=Xenorhabdus nematophila (strain ATCC 19061 / DSM 3370 / CCUG 14189 / LMG 1036 / NCIMB 9965 / AN6) TaxID=406817 RepID=D3VJL1_XENNA|nr:hypothetical protein XNC1_0696 [Xenorhabdus nematophila ATCC 19061]
MTQIFSVNATEPFTPQAAGNITLRDLSMIQRRYAVFFVVRD